MYGPDQELLEPPTMGHFDPKGLEYISSEISGIPAAGSSTTTFVWLFMGVSTSSGFGYIVGTQVVCLLLQRVEGHTTIFKRRGIVTKAGDDET
jgi:hypothetical protein